MPAASIGLAGSEISRRKPLIEIGLVSAVGLLLEMLLIRWIGTEIRIFACLQNTILVVCFLGLGMGCFTCRQPIRMRRLLLPLATLAVILAWPTSARLARGISDDLGFLPDLVLWRYETLSAGVATAIGHVVRGLLLVALLTTLVWEMFVPLGRLLGRLLDDHPRTVVAYSVNVAGSLVGIWLFVVLSALHCPPVVWMACVGVMLLMLIGPGPGRAMNVALLGVAVCATWLAGHDPQATEVVWSPYQKLVLRPIDNASEKRHGDYYITVNNVGYQAMVDLSPAAVLANPDIPAELRGLSQYDLPLVFQPRPKNVLIVGAGSGNDVAGALRGGAEHITAVDIDPVILEMGRRYHPERPYDSSRVKIVQDDARSFFAGAHERYDLIIFGLLDSHTTTAMTNARLDHYVYTRESLELARKLLTGDGIMVLTFMVQEPFISDRIARTLREVFGHDPLVFARSSSRLGWGGTMFVAGNEKIIAASLAAHPKLAAEIARWQRENPVDLSNTTPIATDDWPYIYLAYPRVPSLYFLLALLLLGLFAYGCWRLELSHHVARGSLEYCHLFFTGAAFLLLEVQNISKASVVLGNTWLVNAVVISGVLLMVLAANLLAARLPRISSIIVAVGLLGSTLGLYCLDLAQLAALPYTIKSVLVGALLALPMFFGGVVFIRSFAHAERKDLALGANLMGALCGAVLEPLTFLFGIKSLLLVVAAFYLAALATHPPIPGKTTSLDNSEPDAAPIDDSELLVGSAN